MRKNRLKQSIEAVKQLEDALTVLGRGQDVLLERAKKVKDSGGDVSNLVRKHQVNAMKAHVAVTELVARKSWAIAAYEILGDKDLTDSEKGLLKAWQNPVGRVVVDKGEIVMVDPMVSELMEKRVGELDRVACERWLDKALSL